MWGPIPAAIREEAGYIVDRSVIRQTQRDRHPFTITFTPTGNLESPINLALLTPCPWNVGGSQSTSRESIQTHGEQGLGSALHTTQQQDRCTVALKGQMNCILRKHQKNGGKKHTKHN